MTSAGWIIMLSSVGTVTALFGWCLYRVLSHKPPLEHLHGLNIDTHDIDPD